MWRMPRTAGALPGVDLPLPLAGPGLASVLIPQLSWLMRSFLRIVAGVNAVFQGFVGVLAIASPTAAAGLFHLEDLAPIALALIRMFGGLLAGSGLISAVIATNPERNPGLPAAYAMACMLNLAADMLVGLSRALPFSRLAAGMLLQVILVSAVVANSRRAARNTADSDAA